MVRTLAALEETEERREAKEEAAAVFMDMDAESVMEAVAVAMSVESIIIELLSEGLAMAAAAIKVTRARENFMFNKEDNVQNVNGRRLPFIRIRDC